MKVTPLVSHLFMSLGNQLHGFLASMAPFLFLGKPLLLFLQLSMRLPKEPRVVYHITVRVRHEMFETHVYPNGKRSRRELCLGLNLTSEDHKPLIAFALDRGGLGLAREKSMLFDFDMANTWKKDLPILDPNKIFALESFNLWIREAIRSLVPLEARETRGLTSLATAKEGLERFVHTMQGLLQDLV